MTGLTLFKTYRSAVTSAGDRGVVLLRAPRARAPRATRPARASGGGLAGPLAPLLLIAAESETPGGMRVRHSCELLDLRRYVLRAYEDSFEVILYICNACTPLPITWSRFYNSIILI